MISSIFQQMVSSIFQQMALFSFSSRSMAKAKYTWFYACPFRWQVRETYVRHEKMPFSFIYSPARYLPIRNCFKIEKKRNNKTFNILNLWCVTSHQLKKHVTFLLLNASTSRTREIKKAKIKIINSMQILNAKL